MTDYKELRALCDAATDGGNPIDVLMDSSFCDGWQAGYSAAPDCRTECEVCDSKPQKSVKTCREKPSVSQQKEARKFIAATDPQTVRALIDEVEKYRAALEEIAGGPEPLGDYITGIRCGVEDRDLYDRYECAEYGYEEGLDYCAFIAQQALKGTGHE